MSQAFLPTLRSRLTSPYSTDDGSDMDESVYQAPSVGNTGTRPSLSRSSSPSLNEAISPQQPPYAKYLSDLQDVSGKLMEAYQAPQPGMARQVLGALFGRRNPQLGAVISGQAQRDKTIQPLQQQYGLLENALNSSLAQYKNASEIQKNRYIPSRNGIYDIGSGGMVPGSGNTPTPQEQAMKDLDGQVNPDTQKPYTPSEAYRATLQMKQDVVPDKEESASKTVVVGNRVKQWNPKTKAYDIDLGASPRSEAAPQNPPRTMVAVPQPDGSSKVMEVTPGSTIPKGAMTVSQEGGLAKPGKPTADEQRRSDLAENLTENLDKLDEIATRRPDLFGPLHGRITALKGIIGSDDPDIGTLETIKHQIGMAQISAHGMRSAQGIEGASQSIMNSFKNGPEAVKASTKAARDSVKTFTQDVERAKSPGGQAAPDTQPPAPGGLQIQRDPKTGRITGIS